MKPSLASLLASAGAPAVSTPEVARSSDISPAKSRVHLLDVVETYHDLVEAGRTSWRSALDVERARLGREGLGLSTEEMNVIGRRPERREHERVESEARESAKAALTWYRYDAGIDPKESDWLESWLGSSRTVFEEALQRAEGQAEKARRIAANKPALDALVAEVKALPETAVEAFQVGDHGVSTVGGMPPVFRVEKVTHRGARVLARRLVGADDETLVKLTPSVPGAYMRSATWYRRVPKTLADRYVDLWKRIYA